jgi:hypothetical protein
MQLKLIAPKSFGAERVITKNLLTLLEQLSGVALDDTVETARGSFGAG